MVTYTTYAIIPPVWRHYIKVADPAQKKIVHIGGSPYIRGRASRFNSLLFRTFVIIRVAWDSVKPFPVRRESAHIIETMTIHLRENENLIGV